MAKVKVDLGVAEVIGKVKDTETINQADKTTALLIRAVHAALSPLEKWVLQKESNIEQTRKLLEKKLKNVPVENIITPPMYIGVPAIINKKGVREILQLKLNAKDQAKFNHSCEILKENIEKEIKPIMND